MLPTLLQQTIHLSRYARWRDEFGRRETWEETVDRYVNFFQNFLLMDYGLRMEGSTVDRVTNAIVNLEAMPSMRALMTAGPALARDHIAGYNPVTGDTRVLTREHGVAAIRDLEGTTATVLNKDGRWAEAEFHSYGEQETLEITVKLNSNTVKTVRCSYNHRWVIQDGRVVPAENLSPGDRIAFMSAPRPEIDDDYRLGVIHGIVYGDGTATKSCGRVKGYHIRLCCDADDLLPWFDGYPVCYPPSANGDPVVMLYDGFAATHSLKELPSEKESESYLLGFMRGWLAADGYVSKASQVQLCAGGDDRLWVHRVSAKLGMVVQHERRQDAETNYGKRKRDSWLVYFSRSSMIPGDFLIGRKRDRFRPLDSHFVVDSVRTTEQREAVYCAEVEDTNTFVLDGGLVTGNCSYRPINTVNSFDEILYILMCGTGVGFSVERQYVAKLPAVPAKLVRDAESVIHVADSKNGWAMALRQLLAALYGGVIPTWDVSKVRPSGTRLKTMGGRASGPAPLVDLFEFAVRMFEGAKGRKLTSVECHDLACKVGDCVVVGGVRRSALISLSNLSDNRMRDAKMGEWWNTAPWRRLSNNSICYTEKPEVGQFMHEWVSLYESKSGERGIFNREAARIQAMKYGYRKGYWDQPAGAASAMEEYDHPIDFGTNPCSEIILRPMQFCNLTEVVARADDDFNSLARKVEVAAILGTWQSCLTTFRHLGKKWRENCEEERLLGVSITGIMDCPLINGTRPQAETAEALDALRRHARETNVHWAGQLGIPESTAITCVKPSGTVSLLVNSPAGIHTRYARHIVRRVRMDAKDPMAQMMRDAGIPCEPEAMAPDSVLVFSFPVEAPATAVTRDDRSAIMELEHWKLVQDSWCEHKPSVTINVREHEWPEVGGWVYKHFDQMSGVSFLPHSDHVYKQAPNEEITEDQFKELVAAMPARVDWDDLRKYEGDDHTTGSQELACVGGACEI